MVPRLNDNQEVKIKKKWRDPGFANDYFSVAPPVKPNVLNEWVADRAMAPDRTFKKMCIESKPDFRYTTSQVHNCGNPPPESMSSRYQHVLKKQQSKFTDWVERPLKYTKLPDEPLCFKREIKFFANDKTNKRFGFETHSTWETF